jgi:hypothetical protein
VQLHQQRWQPEERSVAEVMINGKMEPSLIEGGRLVKTLSIGFLADLEEDWRAHGKKVFPVLREKHPQAYFGGLVALSKVIKWDAAETEMFDKTLSPEEIMDKLEQRVGPEGRRTAASGLATTWQSVPTYLRPAWKQDFAYA